MSESVIVRHCAPTLAGLKTANLFNCTFPDEESARRELKRWDQTLAPRGLRLMPLRFHGGRVLVYAYRPNHLRRDLCDQCAMKMLDGKGYPCGCPELCLARLARRIREDESFPDEIGLFLGYPPEDVLGFMEKRECKCTGFWKVYGDEEKAKELFAAYRQCTEEYCCLHKQGCSLEQLTVIS